MSRTATLALVLAACTATCGALRAAPAPAPDASAFRSDAYGERLELIGLIVNGVDRSDGVTARLGPEDEVLSVRLAGLLEQLGASLISAPTGYVLQTPIGAATLSASDLPAVPDRELDNREIAVATLAAWLKAKVRFDPGEYALRIEVPWSVESTAVLQRPSEGLVPDIRAPRFALSRLRFTSEFSRQGDLSSGTLSSNLMGLAGPGIWNLDFTTGLLNSSGSTRVQSLWWLAEQDRHRVLVGYERATINPLLDGLDLTGVQYAYTNDPEQVYRANYGDLGQLVPNQGVSASVIRGLGPPGGTAELRINGVVFGMALIDLDGRYSFRDVPGRAGAGLPVEVALYEFGRNAVPIRVDNFRSQASALQLPKGSYFHYLGGGALGYPFGNQLGSAQESGAFYQSRVGVTDWLTLDFATQVQDGEQQSALGSALNLGRAGAWAAYFGQGRNGRSGYQILGEGREERFFWRADAIQRDPGFRDQADLGIESRRAEFGFTPNERLELSLLYGRYFDGFNRSDDYFLPAARWRPFYNVSLAARPDVEGNYSYNALWAINRQHALSASRFERQHQIEYQYAIDSTRRARVISVRNEQKLDRYGLYYDQNFGGTRRTALTVGVFGGDGDPGYSLELNREVLGGLYARLRIEKNALLGTTNELLSTFSLTGDYALTSAGFIPSFAGEGQMREGAIAGRMRAPDSWDAPVALENVPILLNGRVQGRTLPGGRYVLERLDPGVYQLELDGEGLPIEWVPASASRLVEVRGGGVTQANFVTEVRLGLAGRVHAELRTRAAAISVLADDGASPLIRSTLNPAGFYRVDGLRPGTYHVTLLDADGAALATRTVELKRSFLFGQDF